MPLESLRITDSSIAAAVGATRCSFESHPALYLSRLTSLPFESTSRLARQLFGGSEFPAADAHGCRGEAVDWDGVLPVVPSTITALLLRSSPEHQSRLEQSLSAALDKITSESLGLFSDGQYDETHQSANSSVAWGSKEKAAVLGAIMASGRRLVLLRRSTVPLGKLATMAVEFLRKQMALRAGKGSDGCDSPNTTPQSSSAAECLLFPTFVCSAPGYCNYLPFSTYDFIRHRLGIMVDVDSFDEISGGVEDSSTPGTDRFVRITFVGLFDLVVELAQRADTTVAVGVVSDFDVSYIRDSKESIADQRDEDEDLPAGWSRRKLNRRKKQAQDGEDGARGGGGGASTGSLPVRLSHSKGNSGGSILQSPVAISLLWMVAVLVVAMLVTQAPWRRADSAGQKGNRWRTGLNSEARDMGVPKKVNSGALKHIPLYYRPPKGPVTPADDTRYAEARRDGYDGRDNGEATENVDHTVLGLSPDRNALV